MIKILNWIIKIFDVSGWKTLVNLKKNIKKINYWFEEDKKNIWKDFNISIKKITK